MRVRPLHQLVALPVAEVPVNVVQLDPEDTAEQIIRVLRREYELGERRVILAFPPKEDEIANLPYVFDQLSRFKRQTGLNVLIVAPSGSWVERFAQPGHFLVQPTLEECATLLAGLRTTAETEMSEEPLPPLATSTAPAEEVAAETNQPDESALITERGDDKPTFILYQDHGEDERDSQLVAHMEAVAPPEMPEEDLQQEDEPADYVEQTTVASSYDANLRHGVDDAGVAEATAASDEAAPNETETELSPGQRAGVLPDSSGAPSFGKTAELFTAEPSEPEEQPTWISLFADGPVAGSATTPPSTVIASLPHWPRRRGRILRTLVAALLILLLVGVGSAIAVYGGPQGAMAQVLQSIGQDHATVTFAPAVHPVQVDSILTASPAASFNPTQRLLPLRLLSATSPTQSATAPATGTKTIPAVPATGTITFSSYNFGQAVTIPAGTSFQASNGIGYATTGSVTIPAAQLGSGGPTPGQASANAQAQQAGAAGNTGPNSINTVYGNSVVVQNTGSFTGGQDAQHLHIVQQSDITGLEEHLITQLQPHIQQALAAQVGSADVQIGNFSYAQQMKSSAQAGDVADSVTVTMRISGSGLTYNRDQYVQTAQALLVEKAGELGPNYQLLANQWRYSSPKLISQAKNHTIYFQVLASGWAAYHFTPADLAHLTGALAGRSSADAQTYLKHQVPNLDPATVSVALPWGITKLPSKASDITIQVRPPQVPATTS
jgi:hypothetical protein